MPKLILRMCGQMHNDPPAFAACQLTMTLWSDCCQCRSAAGRSWAGRQPAAGRRRCHHCLHHPCQLTWQTRWTAQTTTQEHTGTIISCVQGIP